MYAGPFSACFCLFFTAVVLSGEKVKAGPLDLLCYYTTFMRPFSSPLEHYIYMYVFGSFLKEKTGKLSQPKKLIASHFSLFSLFHTFKQSDTHPSKFFLWFLSLLLLHSTRSRETRIDGQKYPNTHKFVTKNATLSFSPLPTALFNVFSFSDCLP